VPHYRVAVNIVPRRGILDPQGKAVTDALHSLGFAGVRDVHVGRYIVIDLDADEEGDAIIAVRDMCGKLLANPVTEDFIVGDVKEEA
jgi:phosphoribosylformylglycinamidine synthase subunit PurS